MVSEMRKTFARIASIGAAAAALLLMSAAAEAQTTCGVTANAAAAGSINYDPFASGSGLQQISIPFTLTRTTGSGGKKTQQVNFVLTKPIGAPAYEVTYQGASILYTAGSLNGHPTLNSQSAGEVNFNFGGASQPDTVTLASPIVVTVPAGLDLSAGLPINFDIVYVCDGTGGLANVTTPTTQPSAVHINVNVLSALQASYVGSAFAFGQVGDKTTTQILADASYTTPSTNHLFVRSSGPYSVAVHSDNGYKLKFAGSAGPNDELAYKAAFLGQVMSSTSTTFTQVTCQRASLTGENLAIRARLMEGGVGKSTSDYSDTITVTITPLTVAGTTVDCDTVALPSL
jgi:hypothetical protein